MPQRQAPRLPRPRPANRPNAAWCLPPAGRTHAPTDARKSRTATRGRGKTLIDWTLDRFAAAGVTDIVVNSHYKAEMLEQHLQHRTDLEIRISAKPSGSKPVAALPALYAFRWRAVLCCQFRQCLAGRATPTLDRLASRWDPGQMDALLLLMSAPRSELYEGPGDFMMDAEGG